MNQIRTIAFGALMLAVAFPLMSLALGFDGGGFDRGRREPPATIRARQLFFGAENVNANTGRVDRDKVLFSWLTNTTYAVAVKGRVFMLDSFVSRLEVTPGRTPFVIQDVVDLRPEAILLGHGHGDHADNAAYIAKQVGIPIYSSPETCAFMQLDAARIFGADATVDCIGIVSPASAPGAEIVKLDFLEPVACVTAFKHVHSGSVPHDPDFPLVTLVNDVDPRDAEMFPVGTSQNEALDLRTTAFGGTAGSISLFYQFVLRGRPHFSFAWHDTVGPLKEQAPALFDLMDSLPKTDVQLGSIVSLGFETNGLRDVVLYMQHIRPKIFIPGHMTFVALESSSLRWKVAFLQQLDAMSVPQDERPEVRWMVDPGDYARPLVYDPKDRRWAGGTRASEFCRH